ncbi:hypothetical protein ACWD0A_34325 [Streptomyces sp. NPDC002867]
MPSSNDSGWRLLPFDLHNPRGSFGACGSFGLGEHRGVARPAAALPTPELRPLQRPAAAASAVNTSG